jgi:hypothetical protein
MLVSVRMSVLPSIVVAFLLLAAIFVFAAREVAHYRKDQATRTDIYPYTRARLIRRLVVNACVAVEVILLALIRFTLSPAHPIWFVTYVGLVFFFVLVMVVMAFLDFRESVKLRHWSMERLFKEFLHEVREGADRPPETH